MSVLTESGVTLRDGSMASVKMSGVAERKPEVAEEYSDFVGFVSGPRYKGGMFERWFTTFFHHVSPGLNVISLRI